MSRTILAAFVAGFVGAAAHADTVQVSVTGTVVFRANKLGQPLSGVSVGNTGVMSFLVDSNIFVDGIPGEPDR